MDLLKSDVQDFVAMRNAPDSTYALLGRGLDEVANREEAAEAGMDYSEMMKVHEIATKHLDIFGHPEDESDSAAAMRALFGLEEETERSLLGGKGIKGMMGSKTAYLSRSGLPKDVDNPKKLRTLSSRMQNAFNELLDKHCVTNELDNGGEIMKPRIEGPKIRMEVNFGGCAMEGDGGQWSHLKPSGLRCDKGFISYTKTPGGIVGPYKTGAVYTGSHCPPLEFTFPKSKKEHVVKYFGGQKKIVWESKGLKGSDSGGLFGGLFGK